MYLIRVVPRSYLGRNAGSDSKYCDIDRDFWFIVWGKIKDLYLS